MRGLQELANMDFDQVSEKIQRFTLKKVKEARADGIVLGLSGGIDSSVVAFLAVRALGPKNVVGLIMPDSAVTPVGDVDDAKLVAEALGLRYMLVDIRSLHDSFMQRLPPNQLAEGNLRARIRMNLLYYHANILGFLVAGTGDKSESLLGYFTKHGDGGVDILPIASLYKTQVKTLGKWLGVPKGIVDKKSSPQLWPGHVAEEELGATYDLVDQILYLAFDLRRSSRQIVRQLGLKNHLVVKVLERHSQSAHKRRLPPVCRI